MDIFALSIPAPVALAVIATIGYLFGRSSRRKPGVDLEQARRELKRAKAVAKELETIAEMVRRNLASHHASVARFKDRVHELSSQRQESSWIELCKEAEQMLKPTMQLATQIAHAYDEIRQQSNHLMQFTEVRTDPLTKVSNRRALDETLETMFALYHRYGQAFAITLVDIDHFKLVNDQRGHLQGDRVLQAVARLIDDSVRDTDLVARYGGEEFVVVMPHTDLDGACVFAERLRRTIARQMELTISAGVAAACEGDDSPTLVSRADAALYSAKAAGRDCVFRHGGMEIEAVQRDVSVVV